MKLSTTAKRLIPKQDRKNFLNVRFPRSGIENHGMINIPIKQSL